MSKDRYFFWATCDSEGAIMVERDTNRVFIFDTRFSARCFAKKLSVSENKKIHVEKVEIL